MPNSPDGLAGGGEETRQGRGMVVLAPGGTELVFGRRFVQRHEANEGHRQAANLRREDRDSKPGGDVVERGGRAVGFQRDLRLEARALAEREQPGRVGRGVVARREDEFLAREFPEGNGAAGGLRVIQRQGDDEAFLAHDGDFQLVVGLGQAEADDAEVDAAVDEFLDLAGGGQFREADFHVGVTFAEAAQDGGQPFVGKLRDEADGEAARLAAGGASAARRRRWACSRKTLPAAVSAT